MKTSVALCTYNGEKYLSQQLESIFQQSHPVDEIIVCDDGSTDNTLSILESFLNIYPSVIKIHRNIENLGGRKNFEKCFNLCTGDVIFFCDQDDVWETNKVESTVRWFREDENCLAIATDARLIGEEGEDLQKSFWQSFVFSPNDLELLPVQGLYDFVLRYHNVVAGATLAVRKEATPYIYPFRFPLGVWHDEWIVVVLSSLGKLKLKEQKLIRYRLHSDQQAGVGKDTSDMVSWIEIIKSKDKLRAEPQAFLSHSWYSFQKVQQFKKVFNSLEINLLEDSLRQQLQEAKRSHLRQRGFLMRKAKLLKWFAGGQFRTSLKDVVVL